MKKKLYLRVTLLLINMLFVVTITAQINENSKVLFEDDFEAYESFSISDIGDWITIDLDKSKTKTDGTIMWPNATQEQAFIIFDPSGGNRRHGTRHRRA